MSPGRQPKVLLFDIGGVCVLSPLKVILDYELRLSIPPGWINYSISRSAPNGAWHKLERGAIPLDADFFTAFNADLHCAANWRAFCDCEAGVGAGAENNNPRPAVAQQQQQQRELSPLPELDGEWLFNEMMRAAREPDPWMFPALKKLRQSGRYIIGALSNTIIFPEGHPLFHPCWAEANHLHLGDPLLRDQFDVFLSSAHVGVRKPDERMYILAVETLDAFARRNALTERGRKGGWAAGVRAEDILFLDDIGENLKAAKRQGFGTLKVHLGRTYEAVEELERVTGLALVEGDHPKIAVQANKPSSRAKI
ncbi:hypothetical protein E4U41_000741 [Claviceps citrina]|nr:hypothetical protein E4U41_000741 [Claviceps citrina]